MEHLRAEAVELYFELDQLEAVLRLLVLLFAPLAAEDKSVGVQGLDSGRVCLEGLGVFGAVVLCWHGLHLLLRRAATTFFLSPAVERVSVEEEGDGLVVHLDGTFGPRVTDVQALGG